MIVVMSITSSYLFYSLQEELSAKQPGLQPMRLNTETVHIPIPLSVFQQSMRLLIMAMKTSTDVKW